MLNCPKCNNKKVSKSGIIKSRQRYKCKPCNYFYTVRHKSNTATLSQKNLALFLYLEGFSLHAIGRLMNFSHVAVYQWIKEFNTNNTPSNNSFLPTKSSKISEIQDYITTQQQQNKAMLLLIDLENNVSMIGTLPEKKQSK